MPGEGAVVHKHERDIFMFRKLQVVRSACRGVWRSAVVELATRLGLPISGENGDTAVVPGRDGPGDGSDGMMIGPYS